MLFIFEVMCQYIFVLGGLMAKARKPFIVRFIIWLFSIIITLALILGIGCLIVKQKYGVDVFSTISQIKTLNQKVDESKYDSKFSDNDMKDAQIAVNAKMEGLISYTEEDGYKIKEEGIGVESQISADLLLSDKQLGAIINNLINQNEEGMTLDVSGNKLQIYFIQLKFLEVRENEADINIVVKVDVRELKQKMNSFPTNIVAKRIPDYLYISSTSTIKKGENAFEYEVLSKDIEINNLNSQDTKSFLNTLNLVFKFGTSDDFNLMIAKPFVNALIGNSENNGFAYSLRGLGVKDYDFVVVDDINYYVLKA